MCQSLIIIFESVFPLGLRLVPKYGYESLVQPSPLLDNSLRYLSCQCFPFWRARPALVTLYDTGSFG